MPTIAKLFRNGASQAVRLPREFRFEGDEVCVKRIGPAVLLFPKEAGWDLMSGAMGAVDEDFLADRSQPAAERRPGLEGAARLRPPEKNRRMFRRPRGRLARGGGRQ
jgi:antitoxin VapB